MNLELHPLRPQSESDCYEGDHHPLPHQIALHTPHLHPLSLCQYEARGGDLTQG